MAIVSNFFAKACYVGVDRAVGHHHIVVPYLLDYLFAGVYAVAVSEEKQEYVELGASQSYGFAAYVACFSLRLMRRLLKVMSGS